MRDILIFIQRYARELHKPVFVACSLLMAVMIWINFHYKVDDFISNSPSKATHFYYRYFIFLAAFTLPWCFYYFLEGKNYFKNTLVTVSSLFHLQSFHGKWQWIRDSAFAGIFCAMNTGTKSFTGLRGWSYWRGFFLFCGFRFIAMNLSSGLLQEILNGNLTSFYYLWWYPW